MERQSTDFDVKRISSLKWTAKQPKSQVLDKLYIKERLSEIRASFE